LAIYYITPNLSVSHGIFLTTERRKEGRKEREGGRVREKEMKERKRERKLENHDQLYNACEWNF
jgi:hypothetical protein